MPIIQMCTFLLTVFSSFQNICVDNLCSSDFLAELCVIVFISQSIYKC